MGSEQGNLTQRKLKANKCAFMIEDQKTLAIFDDEGDKFMQIFVYYYY